MATTTGARTPDAEHVDRGDADELGVPVEPSAGAGRRNEPLTITIVHGRAGAVARIPLNRGKHALVDLADLPRVAAYRWYANYSDRRWRALRSYREGGRQHTRSLSHEILGLPPAVRVAHVNADGLDNRRANLRRSSATADGAKRRLNRNNRSGYRGVSWYAPLGKWRAEINGKPRHRHLGYYDTAEQAAEAWDKAAWERWGAAARLNFPAEAGRLPEAAWGARRVAMRSPPRHACHGECTHTGWLMRLGLLHRLFYRTRFGRYVDRLGYVRFRHWRLYGERGLAQEHAAVWLYGETLTIEFADEPLAQYRVRYQPDKKHLRGITEPRLFESAFQSPQLSLWELDDAEWLKVIRRPDFAPRQPRQQLPVQASLFA
jgi:hypothetical protein